MTDPATAPDRLRWQQATIESARTVTPSIRSFLLRVDPPLSFRAGQYVDVRLTAPDGYQAQRSYSIASSPGDPDRIELMIQRLSDGEVSGYFHDVAEAGDAVELRGPIGGPFTWMPAEGGPLLLAGGGSGVVPLLSMLRHRAETSPGLPALLLYSARTAADVIAREELAAWAATDPAFALRLRLTREAAVEGGPRRLGPPDIAEALGRMGGAVPRCFVCGGNAFVGSLADLLVDAGVPPGRIRTERFGG